MEQSYINLKKYLGRAEQEKFRKFSQNSDSFDDAVEKILKTGLKQSFEEPQQHPIDHIELDEGVKKDLKNDQQLLLKIIKSEEGLQARKLYRIYREHKRWPSPQKTLRKYLKEMEQKDLIQSKGNQRSPEYEAKGIT